MVGISSALRISDILRLKVSDVWDGKKPRDSIRVHEKKTSKRKEFSITENLNKTIRDYMKEYDRKQNDFLFFSRKNNARPISRQQASNIISTAGDYIGIKEPINNHSMRKTWGYWAYKSGVSIILIMEALNHSSIANTMKYIGITQDDLNEVYINLNL
jgi:integrase